MKAFATGFDCFDLVNHVSARDYFSKHGVSPALGRGRSMVQEAVVCDIDEELGRCRVWVAGARHGHGIDIVLQAVIGLVFNGGVGGFLAHTRFHAAALHHEARDDAVEDGVVVVTLVHIGQEVGSGLGRFVTIQFQRYDAVAGDVEFYLGIAHGLFRQCGGVDDDGGLRYVTTKRATRASGGGFYFCNHVHATDDFSEHGVAK